MGQAKEKFVSMNAPQSLKIVRQAAPLRQQVVEGLRGAIISGRLAPGQRLTEPELTQMMDVSRTVIREALRQLETEGLIELIPNKGPVVRELSIDEAQDLYNIRAVLEGHATRLFVENADQALVKKLDEALQVVVAAYKEENSDKVLETKNQFYDVLYEGAGSGTLSEMLASLHARVWRWRALGLSHPNRSASRSKESMKNLRAILAAIKKADASTAERITREEAHKAAEEVMRLLAS